MSGLKLHENIVTRNFLYELGFAIQGKLKCSTIPPAFNWSQQTPANQKLSDVLLEFPGIVRLIEFKQLDNSSTKERVKYRARHIALKAAIGENAEKIILSKSIHWVIETNPDDKTFISRLVPYLDAYADSIDSQRLSLEQFTEATAQEAVNEQAQFSIENLRHYLSFIALFQGSDKVGIGGLLLAINAEGYLRFAELTDMTDLRLQPFGLDIGSDYS